MHSQRWKRKSTVVFNIGYQLIWCTKYRRRVLAKDVETRLKDLLCQKAKQINVETIKTEVMPGHVHLFVKAEPTAPLDYRTDERIHITNPSWWVFPSHFKASFALDPKLLLRNSRPHLRKHREEVYRRTERQVTWYAPTNWNTTETSQQSWNRQRTSMP